MFTCGQNRPIYNIVLHIFDRYTAPCIKVPDCTGVLIILILCTGDMIYDAILLFIIYNPVQFILSRHFKRAFYSLFTLFITASFLGGLVNLIPFQTRTRSVCAWMGKTLVKVAYLRDARV